MSKSEPAEKCSKCGGTEFGNYYEGTFTPAGRVCLGCGEVIEGPHIEGEKIGIKTWRKAWYEEQLKKTGILPLDFYIWFDMNEIDR